MPTQPLTHIIDAHHHLWNPVSSQPDIGYVWLKAIGAPKPFGDPTPIQRDYLLEEFRNEPTKATLIGSVHLQADGAIPDPVAETAFVQSLSDESGYPIAIVGFVDLAGKDARDVISRHISHPNFRGVRQILSRLADRPDISFAAEEYLLNALWIDQFALLSEFKLSFDAQLYPEQMLSFARHIQNFPDVQIIIDHAGSPYDRSNEGISLWREGLAALASLENVSIKLCGFGMFDSSWNGQSVRPILEDIETMFGTDRMLFASNFPVDKLMRAYDPILEDLLAHFESCSTEAIENIFCNNAKRIYRF